MTPVALEGLECEAYVVSQDPRVAGWQKVRIRGVDIRLMFQPSITVEILTVGEASGMLIEGKIQQIAWTTKGVVTLSIAESV